MVASTTASACNTSGHAQVVAEDLFHFLVSLEVQKAQRLRYVVSVVYLDVESHARALEMSGALARRLRAVDTVTVCDGSAVALMLVDAGPADLLGIVGRLQDAWLHDLAWSAGGACYPQTATSADDLVAQALDMMTRAKRDGGGRLYPGEER